MYSINKYRITKNTIFLYFRMIVLIIVNLFSVRILINSLGDYSYGLYNVIAGTVIMLSTITSSLSASTQRFFCEDLSSNNKKDISLTLNTSIKLYLFISILLIVFCETIGLWFIKNKLNYNSSDIDIVVYVYQYSIMTFIFSLLTIPFSSCVIAKEDISTYSIVSIIDSCLKLLAAYVISVNEILNNLICYSLFLFIVSIIIFFTYVFFCVRKYKIKLSTKSNSNLRNKMFSFSVWTFMGSLAGVLNNQGNNILINVFFSAIVNAARSISFQICNAITSFVTSFNIAIKPPLIKSFIDKQYKICNILFESSNKVILYCMLLICIPVFINTHYILEIWLNQEIGYNIVVFTKLAIIYAIINSLNLPITTMIQATGDIKKYHLYVESIILLSLPLTYFVFRLGFEAEYTYIVSIIVFTLAHVMRLYILKSKVDFISIREYFISFILRSILFVISSYCVSLYIYDDEYLNILSFLLDVLCSSFINILFIYIIGLNKNEKKYIYDAFKEKCKKIYL